MDGLDQNTKIVEYVKKEGPVLPVKIASLLDTNTIMASARLSELTSKKLLKISNAKIGGSPVYYAPGQENKLEMLYKYLADKEKEAYDILKEKKVLKDSECEPSIRVALRNIPDFAFGFKVNEQIFWKWHLLSNNDAVPLVKELIEGKKEEPKVVEEVKEEKPVEVKPKEKEEVKEEKKEEPQEEKKEEVKEEKKKEVKEEKSKKRKSKPDEFLETINKYVSEKGYSFLEDLEIKKNKEVNKLITINSELGKLNYLLFAKNKKKINDSDLRLAHSKAQEKKMPVLFVSSGDLSKKAEKFLKDNSLIIFEKI